AHDQALGLGERYRAGADRVLRGERTPGVFVGDEFDAANEAKPARLADRRMGGERIEPRLKLRSARGRLFADAIALIALDRLHGDRGRDRMTPIGEAVTE